MNEKVERKKEKIFELPWLSTLVPPPEFHLSKKLILVKAPPKKTCPRNLCEIPGGVGNKFVDHGNGGLFDPPFKKKKH